MVDNSRPMRIVCGAVVLAAGLFTSACHGSRNRADELETRIEELEATLAKTKASLATHGQEILRLRSIVLEASKEELLFGMTGVYECDEYVLKYRRCIEDKLPNAVQETSMRALATSIEAWKKAAKTPAGREGLAQACKTARDAVASSCGW
jgi:sugar-specific transcriptional regulator TrmB